MAASCTFFRADGDTSPARPYGQLDVRNVTSGGIDFRGRLVPNEAITSVVNDVWARLTPREALRNAREQLTYTYLALV
jgi:hypothetical protein